MDKLKVWGRRSSFNVQKVMWLIGELDLPHEHVDWGGTFGALDDPAFLAMNPHGRIPVIRDGEAVVWESHTILRYLAARYGNGRFWSDDPVARAQVEGWMD
jgi:glutathione S-transferase